MLSLSQCVTDGILASPTEIQALPSEVPSNERAGCQGTKSADKSSLFENFCDSGLSHLGIKLSHDINLKGIWKEAELFSVRQFEILPLFQSSNVCH